MERRFDVTIRKAARFTVREEGLAGAQDAIRTFVEHTRTEPGTRRYEPWRSLDRPREFLHLMEFEDAAAEHAHANSEAIRAFTSVLHPLRLGAPTFEDWA